MTLQLREGKQEEIKRPTLRDMQRLWFKQSQKVSYEPFCQLVLSTRKEAPTKNGPTREYTVIVGPSLVPLVIETSSSIRESKKSIEVVVKMLDFCEFHSYRPTALHLFHPAFR